MEITNLQPGEFAFTLEKPHTQKKAFIHFEKQASGEYQMIIRSNLDPDQENTSGSIMPIKKKTGDCAIFNGKDDFSHATFTTQLHFELGANNLIKISFDSFIPSGGIKGNHGKA